MTKQDFELIAATLRERESHAPRSHWQSVMRERDETIQALASALSATNPRFNRARFIAACRGEDSYDSAGRRVRYSAS
jgi:nitroreductase